MNDGGNGEIEKASKGENPSIHETNVNRCHCSQKTLTQRGYPDRKSGFFPGTFLGFFFLSMNTTKKGEKTSWKTPINQTENIDLNDRENTDFCVIFN